MLSRALGTSLPAQVTERGPGTVPSPGADGNWPGEMAVMFSLRCVSEQMVVQVCVQNMHQICLGHASCTTHYAIPQRGCFNVEGSTSGRP